MTSSPGIGDAFARFARSASCAVGSPLSFVLHLALVVAFLVAGPFFGWEPIMIVLTTVLTVTTELIAVLILQSQILGERALHLKVDELIRAVHEARDEFRGAESKTESELDQLEGETKP